MNAVQPLSSRGRKWAWYAYDMGNSAHAILVSTVGFALYFKEHLFSFNEQADAAWGAITTVILALSAILSLFLSSWAYGTARRRGALIATTVVCVGATAALASPAGNMVAVAVALYVVSALGYYLALPVYNSYLTGLDTGPAQRISAAGWGLGYTGGVLAVALCFGLGLLSSSAGKRPDLFRQVFLVAAVVNLVLSFPLFLSARREEPDQAEPRVVWSAASILENLRKLRKNGLMRLLAVYWLVGEGAVIVTYYFAIYLAKYAHLEIGSILVYSLLGQLVAAVATYLSGRIAERAGWKRTLIGIILIWLVVPFSLFAITLGVSFWVPIIMTGLVIGAYHAVIRGKIAAAAGAIESSAERGSLFGFLEVAGRISQVVGPLAIFMVSLVLPLRFAILVASVFPGLALLLVRGCRE